MVGEASWFFRLKVKKAMSPTRQTIQDPFKAWKSLVIATIKPADVFKVLMKTTLVFCIVASISLISYFSLSSQSRWFGCPQCNRGFGHSAYQKKTDGDVGRLGYERTNISHILFGIGGSTATWSERRHYCELWWKPNVTRGFVWLDEKPAGNETWPETSPPYQVSGDTSGFKYPSWSGSASAVRIARIVKESFELGLENVRWFVMGDDDTVFFTENLVALLGRYDHNQMYYIGGSSESVEQNMIHSYNTAFGGGGFAISYPLAAELVRVLDECIDRYYLFYGSDQKIHGCLSEIGVPLTKELGFHQVDIRGDPYGFLAAHPVAPLVSLHHLDFVQSLFPTMTQIESLKRLIRAYEADPGRTLQQSICYDFSRNRSVSVAWGYSVQLYPSLVTAEELETPFQTFQTWRSWGSQPFTFNTRPMSQEPCERPVIYFLDRVQTTGINGQTLTTYERPGFSPEKDCNQSHYAPLLAVHSFNISAFQLRPESWKKARRRQCCEVVDDTDGVESVVQVKIRECSHGEILSPASNRDTNAHTGGAASEVSTFRGHKVNYAIHEIY